MLNILPTGEAKVVRTMKSNLYAGMELMVSGKGKGPDFGQMHKKINYPVFQGRGTSSANALLRYS
jgi:hypothetical protein